MKSVQVIVLHYLLVYLQCDNGRWQQIYPSTEAEFEKMQLPLAASMMFHQLSTPWVHVSVDKKQSVLAG